MKERRNFYRILGVQPDASARLIRSAWRTWMQKLQLHPDCGGDPQTAATVNAAYHVLRDPRRRAAYDCDLVRQWNRRELAGSRTTDPGKGETANGRHANRRNYYRVLGVQASVPAAIIDSAYRSARDQVGSERLLLDEAYRVVGDAARRADYDTWLARSGHGLAAGFAQPNPACCLFCKTPHGEYPGARDGLRCWNCTAPLRRADAGAGHRGRQFARNAADAPIQIHESWPPQQHRGRIVELTPAGLAVDTDAVLETGAIVRLDADRFAAVAVVVHHAAGAGERFRCGLQLLRAEFSAAGMMLNARA